MTSLSKATLAPLVYYDLLDRPLTALEIYKYLWAAAPEISFLKFWQDLAIPNPHWQAADGLYHLTGRAQLLPIRQKRLKLAQLKWRRLLKLTKFLALVPFLRLVAITGSLTSYNTNFQSDFDLLIIVSDGRLWLSRLLLTGLVGGLGRRRHGQLTRDRLCLNCYLTEAGLTIDSQAKPHDWHSAQEYGRLTPVLELNPGLYQKFLAANQWLADFLKNYPWPASQSAKQIKPPLVFNWLRNFLEWCLGGAMGDWLEKNVGQWQTRRIQGKRKNEPADQVFISDCCLMFHPQSKSYELIKQYEIKMSQLK